MMGGIQNEPVESASGGRDAGDEADLVAALRRGDEAAFVTLVERYHTALLRLAMLYVGDRPTAEEVVQETWLGVLRGLERCAALVAQDTWLFRILLNRAKTRAQREGRTIGRRGRGIGATHRKSGSSPGRREHASTRPSPCCRPASGR